MKPHRLIGAALFVCAATLAGAEPAPANAELVARLMSFLGISATPSQMKAPDALMAGDIWIADAGRNTRAPLTSDGGYSWPVFDPGGERILALKGSEVLEIPLAGGPARRLASVARITKLIGFDRARPGQVLVLRAEPNAEIAVLSLADGQVTAIAYDPRSSEAGTFLAHLRGEERAYGDTVLYVRKETRNEITGDVLEWSDVFVKEGDKRPRNISQCEGANCRQPSLSADGDRIAFVRTPQN
ncbi:MAG: hypothetical protein QOD25_1732 [Alphaproteobacteria bacterium]|nr:hypothetical protein [Alphaproteobacteria bacterium]